MEKLVIVGLQWGDEGKGKVVSYFSKHYNWIIRYSGGSNAGHTIYINGKKYVNHILPSIDPFSNTKGYIGPGTVISLEKLLKELKELERIFPNISKRFHVDLNASLVLEWHMKEDELFEKMRRKPLGTTRKGIGPAYKDKVSREGVKLFHLMDEKLLSERLKDILHTKKTLYRNEFDEFKIEDIKRKLIENMEKIKSMGVEFTTTLDKKDIFEKSRILFEGSQGVLLDINFGTYPYVTSSSCTVFGIFEGFQFIKPTNTIGVFKVYTTRVGNGPFPTEIHGKLADMIREKGNEYGATTGRKRRIGWLDLPALKYSIICSNVKELIITKVDVMYGMENLKVCVKYNVNGNVKYIPTTSLDFEKAIPVYEEFKGWKNMNDRNFVKFLKFVEEDVGVKIKYVSYGPRSDEMIKM